MDELNQSNPIQSKSLITFKYFTYTQTQLASKPSISAWIANPYTVNLRSKPLTPLKLSQSNQRLVYIHNLKAISSSTVSHSTHLADTFVTSVARDILLFVRIHAVNQSRLRPPPPPLPPLPAAVAVAAPTCRRQGLQTKSINFRFAARNPAVVSVTSFPRVPKVVFLHCSLSYTSLTRGCRATARRHK